MRAGPSLQKRPMLTEDCKTREKKRKIPLERGFSEPVAAQSRAESESEASGTFQDPSRRNGAVKISKEQDWGMISWIS